MTDDRWGRTLTPAGEASRLGDRFEPGSGPGWLTVEPQAPSD
jgi:hypothetical protein